MGLLQSETVPVQVPAIIPGLDGLRAFSIIVVMISHSGLSHIVPGVFGVTVFFFISGFLITSLLIAEMRRTDSIDVGAFYARRMLRLYPPLVVSILATVLAYHLMGGGTDWRGVLAALAYLANYMAIFRPDIMTHLGGQLWSLAVEEHFYFVYPLLFLWLMRRPARFVPVVLALCAGSLLVRIYVEMAHPAIAADYNGKATEARIDSILYGALAAWLWWSGAVQDAFRRHWKLLCILAVGILLGSFLWRNPALRETVRYTVQGLALMPLVLAITVAGVLPRLTRVLDGAPARWIGRLSYSLYLWHMLAFEVAQHLAQLAHVPQLAYPGGWALAFAAAMASYRFIEAPFFALRRRFGSNVATVDGAAIKPGQTAAVRPSDHP